MLPICLMAQSGKSNQINQYNASGKKEGYWVEDRGFDRIETFYRNGQKTGIFKSYTKSQPSTLRYFGEFDDDKCTGKWYRFDEDGRLSIIQYDFDVNTIPVILYDNYEYTYPNKCYSVSYYPSGLKRCEGILFWDESSDSDDTKEYGEWKYYDEDGNLTETKIFK